MTEHRSTGRDSQAAPEQGFDALVAGLVDPAQAVTVMRRRTQELSAANQSIISDLELPVVLRRIVEAACRLAGARYGALGVLDPGGRVLDQFITVGVDEPTAAAIGHLPTGKGLLGALIDVPVPIRLDRMSDDPRSTGFPEHHPPMSSFLGVPIRVRAKVFGNLYLAESAAGRFDDDDQQLVTALAATAGIAIENARLFAQAEHRQRWLEASAVITRQLLAVEGEDPLAVIARQARDIADADLVTVVLPTADPDTLLVEVAAGDAVDHLPGLSYPRRGSLVEVVLETGQPLLVDNVTESAWPWHQLSAMSAGPVMVVPLAGAEEPRGALALGRATGAPPFDDADLAMAGAFANQAALALELADARLHQQRMEVLEDRDRIARDLHDHVIQRLFAMGLGVDGLLARVEDPVLAERLSRLVTDLDTTIAQIRTSVFELRGPLAGAGPSNKRQLLDVIAEVTPLLPRKPDVSFSGPVDSVIGEAALQDLLATVREALTNVARHAQAQHVGVAVEASSDRLVLVVVDDGVGLGSSTRRSGLANIRARAERHGGDVELTGAGGPPDREGTRLTWSVTLG